MLAKTDLFARLAEGHAAGITVVTPNKRLSQALMLEFDSFQIKKNLSVWDAPDILPFGTFVERLYEDALYSDLKTELPMLLAPAQEEELWKQVVAKSGLLAVEGTAAQCRDAWTLSNQWRVAPGAGNDDTAAFASWSRTYREKSKGDVDAARLPDLMSGFLQQMKTPRLVVAYGFDIMPPQTEEFLKRLTWESCGPEKRKSAVSRTAFPSSKAEIEAAAQWARVRLEAGGKRIGVVIPSLQKKRREAVRVFSRVMRPGGEKTAMPFNVSLGMPLDEYPIVRAALSILRISHEEVSFEEASRLIRSPFLGGAQAELGARMRVEARLRRKLGETVALPKLIAFLDRKLLLRERLEKIFALRDEGLFARKTPGEWARHFSAILEAAGFPGERALDSAEFQARAKLHEVLGELARLDRVSSPLSFRESFNSLVRFCTQTLFQPESPDTPIQILGLLESAGLEFDHLWVSGLTDEAWPLKSSPNPFLPLATQRKAGIPQAGAESSLALDRRITDGWKVAAEEVIFSFFVKEEDRDVLPSPLVLDVPARAVGIPAFPRLRDLIFSGKKLLEAKDAKAPPVRERQIRGGTRVLSDQAACPFRAFARWRLAAEPLEEPAGELDASKRGALVHELMKSLWSLLKDSSSLQRNLDPFIEKASSEAVKALDIEGRFAELERARLARLAREWLAIEATRPEFSVVSMEEKRTLQFAGLEFAARIDRMDKLSSGGHALIDYKTSRSLSPKQWEPPRPDDPQLPLYAVSAKEDIAAVAFAKLRPGDMKFMGFSRDEDAIEGVKKAKAWQPLLRSWKDEAESLGAAFAAGEARVDPKRGLVTCRYCGLETLCRVYEKIDVLGEAEEGGE